MRESHAHRQRKERRSFRRHLLGHVEAGRRDYQLDLDDRLVRLPKIPVSGKINTDGRGVFLYGYNKSRYQLQYMPYRILALLGHAWRWQQLPDAQ